MPRCAGQGLRQILISVTPEGYRHDVGDLFQPVGYRARIRPFIMTAVSEDDHHMPQVDDTVLVRLPGLLQN